MDFRQQRVHYDWVTFSSHHRKGFPRWCFGKESSSQCRRCRFDLWVRKIPWKRKWQPTPAFLPGWFHGQRSLMGYMQSSGLVTQLYPNICNLVDSTCQAPLSMWFPRQEYWSGLPFPSPGDLSDPGIEPQFPALQTDSLPTEPPGNTIHGITKNWTWLSMCTCTHTLTHTHTHTHVCFGVVSA